MQRKEEAEEQMQEYRKKLDENIKTNAGLRNAYDSTSQLWLKNKNENVASLNSHLVKTRNLLYQLYTQNFIYDKYRTLPALTSIYEYFITGRCDELTGPHGAYNMYEDEVRKDTVISQLNLVIQHLEQIRQNQYMLYQQVSLIQRQSQQIAYELSAISSYTQNIMQLSAVNAYYSALTAKNTEISANLQLMGG